MAGLDGVNVVVDVSRLRKGGLPAEITRFGFLAKASGDLEELVVVDLPIELCEPEMFAEGRGVDQLVTARLEANDVRETADGIVVSEDTSSMINVSMPVRDRIDIWKPLPLAIDTTTIRLFDLATGLAICRPAAVSTTCPASTPSCGR